MLLDHLYIASLLDQIHFFNQKFHKEGISDIFHELMRQSKNRCQLTLIKHSPADSVWLKKDESSGNQEWLVGVVGYSDTSATHIPYNVLKKHLTDEQLNFWNIK